ncbi:phosphocarrier protein HPr [Aequitasia blattaphilus]|uniref:Phosphocarrier protein HPr n=1 Tax=Aequitasia blattaphilus TaxID=2949332 RepID=A0ABT1EBG3_9FIRM|nr:HPr family phosphocarrier protein [Aequitasia blattaphilus]MCP1102969.1 HPr family phosphocarrier protein [Aequitasia blattaphilus]MCR8615609.1 HPr family phosphocarrier protein [Aequitasia blattaphilus]
MKSFEYVINDELGLHARPAGLLVKEAKKFSSKIMVKKEEKEVQATQLMMLMGMAVKKGAEVTVTIEGEDEEEAAKAMETFFKDNL